MTTIEAKNYNIHFNKTAYNKLNDYLKHANHSKVFILVDSNTHEYCLPIFLGEVHALQSNIEIIEIAAGENHKNIETCVNVWHALSELDADRKSLIINLGGGVVTDLGGFVSCTFKRGISYINVPTTLLSMVDASVGGKTGVDLGVLKNQVGVISDGEMVLIITDFLQTLPQNQLKSGLAEMLKHGLIADKKYWNDLSNLNALSLDDLDALIHQSVCIKRDIVNVDPFEHGLRKTLNFGHTIGHAIESYFLGHSEKSDLLHGEAIAIGMIMEAYISHKLLNFSKIELEEIKRTFLHTFKKVNIDIEDYTPIIDLLKYDKKNSHGIVKFVLLEDIAQPKIDCEVDHHLILEAFAYYAD